MFFLESSAREIMTYPFLNVRK